MGDLIHIEQLRIRREEQLRRYALTHFPWEEIERIRQSCMDPLIHRWPHAKRVILLELSYRLAYESFLSGLRQSAFREEHGSRRPEEENSPGEAARSLVRQLMTEFAIDRWLEEAWTMAVEPLLIQLAEDWYKKGGAARLARS